MALQVQEVTEYTLIGIRLRVLEYEEMAKEQISASGLRIPEAYNPNKSK